MLTWRGPRLRLNLLAAFICIVFLFFFFSDTLNPPPTPRQQDGSRAVRPALTDDQRSPNAKTRIPEHLGDDDVEMVVATMKKENTSWLQEYLPDWHKNTYVVDDPTADLTVPKNKGREAMVVLTYIIDRYDSLPGNIIFHHAERFQWHNDNPDYDALPLLQRFQIPHLKSEGYVNLRCAWVLGCPVEIRPYKDEAATNDGPIHAKHIYKTAFQELFPNTEVPSEIGVACCSQFALRRETIRQRPRADYVRYREWLMNTELEDALSGRVLEYAWHVMFGKPGVHCPDAGTCYCKTYGMCDLDCKENACKGQYTLPEFATLPKGWPKKGWKGEDRDWHGDL